MLSIRGIYSIPRLSLAAIFPRFYRKRETRCTELATHHCRPPPPYRRRTFTTDPSLPALLARAYFRPFHSPVHVGRSGGRGSSSVGGRGSGTGGGGDSRNGVRGSGGSGGSGRRWAVPRADNSSSLHTEVVCSSNSGKKRQKEKRGKESVQATGRGAYELHVSLSWRVGRSVFHGMTVSQQRSSRKIHLLS